MQQYTVYLYLQIALHVSGGNLKRDPNFETSNFKGAQINK